MSVGSITLVIPSNDSTINPVALLPDVSLVPAHVRSVYGESNPLIWKRMKNSDLANDLLPCYVHNSIDFVLICLGIDFNEADLRTRSRFLTSVTNFCAPRCDR